MHPQITLSLNDRAQAEGDMKKLKWIVLAAAGVAVAGIWGQVWDSQSAGTAHGWGDITVVAAPEQTQSQEHPLFIKEVYEPVVPKGENIVRDAKIEDNGYNDVYNARKVKDGNVNGQSYWEGVGNAYPNTLTATFEEERTIHAMKLLLFRRYQYRWGKLYRAYGKAGLRVYTGPQ